MTDEPKVPDPIDASAPGAIHFDDVTVYSLGNNVFLVGVDKEYAEELTRSGEWKTLHAVLLDALGEKFVLLAGLGGFAPLNKQLELRTLLHEVVHEEMEQAARDLEKTMQKSVARMLKA